MASLIEDPGKRWRVQFFLPSTGKRKTVRLGRMSDRDAERFRGKVEDVVSAAAQRRPPGDAVVDWLNGIDPKLRDRLERTGLVESRVRAGFTIADLMREYFAAAKLKPNTVLTYKQTQKCLEEFFGTSAALVSIRPLDAEKWRQKMQADGFAQATISRRVKHARQMFRKAVRWELVSANPFEDVAAGTQKNAARSHFVSREVSDKVMAACPDAQWRLIFALSRYGGLRCPSEHLLLRWSDVDWDGGRVVVTSPKTEHFEGKGRRTIPLFDELRAALLYVFEQAPAGTEHVITRYRERNSNLRTQLQRIIRRAGVSEWPRLFHNLRASRQTELSEYLPSHVVCAFLGNSEKVAEDHYLQVTDAHFAKAVAGGEKAAQKAAQHGDEPTRTETQTPAKETTKPAVVQRVASSCVSSHFVLVTPTGIEPVSRP